MRVVVVDYPEQDVHDLFFYVRPKRHELAKEAVKDGLEVITLAGVFRVEQLQEIVDELVREVLDYLVRFQVRC